MQRDQARNRLHLLLLLVMQASIRPLLDRLIEAGVVPTLLEKVDGDRAVQRISLLYTNSEREDLFRRMTVGAAAFCVGLTMATVSLPFILQFAEDQSLKAEIAVLHSSMAEASLLHINIKKMAEGISVVDAERARIGDALSALATLTNLLPDDTSLTDFTLHQGRFTMSGQSNAAARLVAALSNDPAIRNPSFAAPVTRTENGVDQFIIGAEIGH